MIRLNNLHVRHWLNSNLNVANAHLSRACSFISSMFFFFFFTDVPLTHLDLTGFLNVTDKGVQAIGEIKTLEFLGLEGTKITDAGLEGFQGGTWVYLF